MFIVSIYTVKDYCKRIIEVKFNDLDKAMRFAEETWKGVDDNNIEISVILPALSREEADND